MCFNPMLTTAENLAFVAQRDAEQRAGQESEICCHALVSIPNGMIYGKTGHVPCYHHVEFMKMDGTFIHYNRHGEWKNGHVPMPLHTSGQLG